MNVIITDAQGMYVWGMRKHTIVFGYRMFGTGLVIFTNHIFFNPIHSIEWSTERNPTCLFPILYLFMKT